MSGVVWAAVAGVSFGVFQSVNRATLVEMDVYESTFIQLLASSVVLVGALVLVRETGQLAGLSMRALLNFALAGLVHFLGGWTLLNMSQKQVGAARTSPLLATTPLFGTVLAVVTLREIPGAVAVLGMLTIVVGVYVIQLDRAGLEAPVRHALGRPEDGSAVGLGGPKSGRGHLAARLASSRFGLGAAFAWAVSPIFIRQGLHELASPLVGVTIGVVAATSAYGLLILARRRRGVRTSAPRQAVNWKIAAGVLVALATWTRWYALSRASVAAVLSLGLLSVPTVIALAPVLAGQHLERVTPLVVLGSALVLTGALVLILRI